MTITTPASQRVPIPTKLAWSSGVIAHTFMANSFSYMAFPIYNIGLKVPAEWLGWALSIPRFLDAFIDPLIGHLSDNTRSRWGRRRPYVLIGGLLSALLFALIWMPPATSGVTAVFAWFFIISLIYYLAYSLFVVPWNALGLELTTDYHERTRVMAWKNFIENCGGLLLGAAWLLSIKFGKMSGGTEVDGARWVGVLFGIVIALSSIASAVFCKERFISSASVGHTKISFWSAVKTTISNRSFLQLGAGMILIFLGLFLCNAFSNYISLYYIYGGNKLAQAELSLYANGIFQLGGLLLTPLVAWVGTTCGKKATLIGGLMMTMLGYASTWYLYTPDHPYLQLVSFLLMAPGLSCVWILTASMLADICDVDEEQSGLRREGMYGAMFSWLVKMGIAGTLVLSGYMLTWSGYDPNQEAQPAEVLTRMRVLYAVMPIVFITAAIVVISRYRLTESFMQQVRVRLDERARVPPEVGSAT